MSRPSRRWTAVAAAALISVVAVPVARGHSTLLETRPANDAVVEESPTRVLLRYDEPVEAALGSVQVFDGSGRRVDAGEISKPAPEQVAVAIDDELARGTYTVTWRAISADSDPISGAFVFHVHEPGRHPSGIAAQVLNDTPALVSGVYTGGRFLDFLMLLLCVGGVAALVYPLRSADERLHRRLYGLLALCAGILAAVALLGIPFQGAAAGGFGLGEAFTSDVVSSVAETRFGKASLVRAGLALALLAVALVLRHSPQGARALGQPLAILLAAGLVLTPSFSGHASVSGPVSLTADVVHVLAAATWVGGLGFVVVALALALEERWPLATRSVPRFSTMAVVSVAILLIAGTVNGYLQIKAWRGLWETQYGLLLLAKVALVLPLLALGAFNNRYAVPQLRAGAATPRERRRFLRMASAELVIMIAIVGVTAVLVNAPPAKSEVEMHAPATVTAVFSEELQAHVAVEPATAGRNDVHLMFMGTALVEEVKVSATLASKGIGPLRYTARPGGHAGFLVRGAQFAIPGDWQLRIEARVGQLELLTETVSIAIREES